LLEPYEDLPSSTGLNTSPIADLHETARLAMEHDYQLCVHAIGDRANREVLDVYQTAFEANADKSDLRWRIEHAQHLHPDDIPRFGELGVIAAMQGVHCTSDGPWVIPRLGEQRAREGAYVWRTLWDLGTVISNGTDAPVEDVDPIASYYATVSRKMKDGNVFFPEQRLTRMEALQTYTIKAAYAGFEEDIKGSLTPGKLADITVLSRDILTIPEDEIPTAEIVYTIVGGKVMYRKEAD
jgi:predicted amidohydrolase YtcJ